MPGVPRRRLKELEGDGIVQRITGTGRGVQYELTSWGRQLEPVVTALGRWGALHMEEPDDGEIVTSAGLATMLRTGFAGRSCDAPKSTTTFEVRAGELAAHAVVHGDRIEVGTGRSEAPDIRIPAGPRFRELLAGEIDARDYAALPDTVIDGDLTLLVTFTDLFRIPLTRSSA